MKQKRLYPVAGLVAALISGSSLVGHHPLIGQEAEVAAPARKPRAKIVRVDKKQPWLRASHFSVATENGVPRVRIRFRNEHAERDAVSLKTLGSGTARDDFGTEYKVYSTRMVDTLEPGRSLRVDYSFLPKIGDESTGLLMLLSPIEERVLYVQLELVDDQWEVEKYGTWKEKRAYFNQNDWAEKRKAESPYRQAAATVRTWQDETGEFSVEASFVDFRVDKKTATSIVSLKRADDGKTIEVPQQRLSEEDQKYIRELLEKRREKKDERPIPRRRIR